MQAGDGAPVWSCNADLLRPAASLIKIPIAMTVFDRLADRLRERVEITEAARVDGDGPLDRGGAWLHAPTPTSATLHELIAYSLRWSDNTAANLLIDRVGMEAVNNQLAALGLQTRLQRMFMDYAARAGGRDNVTTALDVCTIFGQLQQPRYAPLLGLLHEAVGSGKLEAGLPPGTRLAHKVGDLPDVEHDAGIVFAPNGAYRVAVLGAELIDTPAARQVIAQISGMIWAIMTDEDGR